jgi:hypothetical protein
MKDISLKEHNKRATNVVHAFLKYAFALKNHEKKNLEPLPDDEKANYLYVIREKVKAFQQHRKKLFVKDQEVPLENQLLKVNHKISFEFD